MSSRRQFEKVYYLRFGSSIDRSADTPLHSAVKHTGNVAVIRELVQLHPPALEVVNKEGQTSLHMAVMRSNSAVVVRELAQLYPAALDIKDKYGQTPLHLLCDGSTPEAPRILRVLLDAAPQTASLTNDCGRIPLHTRAIIFQ